MHIKKSVIAVVLMAAILWLIISVSNRAAILSEYEEKLNELRQQNQLFLETASDEKTTLKDEVTTLKSQNEILENEALSLQQQMEVLTWEHKWSLFRITDAQVKHMPVDQMQRLPLLVDSRLEQDLVETILRYFRAANDGDVNALKEMWVGWSEDEHENGFFIFEPPYYSEIKVLRQIGDDYRALGDDHWLLPAVVEFQLLIKPTADSDTEIYIMNMYLTKKDNGTWGIMGFH
jgi:cell division protein FtsB